MDITKAFLESSTIHGLFHISASKAYSNKIFWIVVVFLGFSGAGVMIYQSFQTWAESPITTTIETLPITKITLPKVTVCPPKNTFTDLNYDLMRLENVTLNNETRNALKMFASDVLLDHHNSTVLKVLNLLEEDDRYYNWYHGYSNLIIPSSDYDYEYPDVETRSKSGKIATQNFGEHFNSYNMDMTMKFWIKVIPPAFSPCTLHFDIKKVSMKGLDEFYIGWDLIDSDTTNISRNFTFLETGADHAYIYYKRKVSKDAIKTLNLNSMPGFQLEWYYSCNSYGFQDDTEDDESEGISSMMSLRAFSDQAMQLNR